LRPKQSYAREVRIVPKTATYIVEVVCEKPVTVADFKPKFIAGIDLESDNLVAMTAKKPTFRPTIYDGKHLKSINPGFNKRARLSNLPSPTTIIGCWFNWKLSKKLWELN
jgi:transposase